LKDNCSSLLIADRRRGRSNNHAAVAEAIGNFDQAKKEENEAALFGHHCPVIVIVII
jgi:hypothetical protein